MNDSPHSRWKEVDALFQKALDLPEAERGDFLASTCGDDRDLMEAVEALLRAEGESSGFMANPVDALTDLPWDHILARAGRDEAAGEGEVRELDRSGERIGPYRLLEKLGRGGMATVYLAERADGLWTQKVALKLVRRGLDTEDVLRRFRSERQILSSLNHPNIGRLLDGGTTGEGLPYLVMEYVQGIPITRYCQERRLSLEERLRLFCSVCRAVQHAHQSLVVHRDLKPSNILVTQDHRVKLLDFGIAKILDPGDEGERTRTGLLALTPEYASPEQVEGGSLTTASDVYQLGMLLCEILTGQRPYEVHRRPSQAGLAQYLKTVEASPPSALVNQESARGYEQGFRSLLRHLRGELDSIVLHAVPKAPEDRYPSAEALLADLERFLEGRPIRAKRRTVLYRTRKLFQRRPWLLPGLAVGALALIGYGATMVRHSADLEEQRNLARMEAERAEEVQTFLIDLFRTADPYSLESSAAWDLTVVEALGLGAARIRSEFADRPGLQATLLAAISDVYANLDLIEQALALRREALALEKSGFGQGSSQVARGLRSMGVLLSRSGQNDSARAFLNRSLALTRSHSGSADTTVAGILIDLGKVEALGGELTEAEALLTEAVGTLRDLDPLPAGQLARAYTELLDVYPRQQRMEEARKAAGEAVRLSGLAHGLEHPRTALAMVEAADLGDWEGDGAGAVSTYREAIRILDRTLGSRHQRTLEARNNLAVTLRHLGDLEEAEAVQRRIVATWREKEGNRSRGLADALQNLAVILLEKGALDEAEGHLREARDLYDATLSPDHYLRAFPRLSLASVRLETGDFEEAERSARAAAEILSRALPEANYVTATAKCRTGRALAGQGFRREARVLLETSVRTLAGTSRPSIRYEMECRKALADLYLDLQEDELSRAQMARVRALEGQGGDP